MPYLNAVCNEVLRYFGPVPLTIREGRRDTDTYLDTKVPKGTRIILYHGLSTKSFELWGPDALKFDPDRWDAQVGSLTRMLL